MKTEKVRFPGSGGAELGGRLDLPDGAPLAWALFAHCFTCGKDLKALARLSRALVGRGLGVLRFDFTGLGESTGDFAATTFASNLDDLRSAARWLEESHGPPRLLLGHSLGGAAVLAVAGDLDSVDAVVVLGAPSDPGHLRRTLLEAAPELEDEDVVEVQIAGRPIRLGRALLDDLQEQTVLDRVADLRRPLLVLHSPVDSVVGIDHAAKIYRAARHPKSFVSLDDADHLLLEDPDDARWVGELVATWARRYLEVGEVGDAALEAGSDLPGPGVVRVDGGPAGLRVDVATASHRFVADEPESLGGTDEGPTPYDLLLAALGTCTAMTVRIVADREDIPLRGIRVDLEHRRIHARDCEDCESADGRLTEISRTLSLAGDLTSDQRERLLAIADRCPVHKTLSREIKIRSRGV